MDELSQLLATLSEEEIAQLMGMGTLDERSAIVQEQLAQAQALRDPSKLQHSTGAGAAFGAGAHVLDTINSGLQQRELRGKQDELLKQKDSGRNLYLDALRRGRQPSALSGTAGMGDLPPSLFGLG